MFVYTNNIHVSEHIIDPYFNDVNVFVKLALIKEKNPYFGDGEMVLLVAYDRGVSGGKVLLSG